jgi:hypothetical protein
VNIRAEDLEAGDILTMNDRSLHVVRLECDRGIAVLTAEFDFLIHFLRDEPVDISTVASDGRIIEAACSTTKSRRGYCVRRSPSVGYLGRRDRTTSHGHNRIQDS